MNTVMQGGRLTEIFDQVVREITPLTAGIDLRPSEAELVGELCTVYITFVKGLHTSLSLCAELALFTRLAQRMMMEEQVTLQDVEAVAKEYFNVLCGHISARLFPTAKIPVRFSIPAFYQGRYTPEEHLEHIVLTYSSDENESVRLIHHVPFEECVETLCQN